MDRKVYNHTCSTLQSGPCKACEDIAAQWLATDAQISELPKGGKGDLYSRNGSSSRVSLDTFGADAFGDWESDPQRAYDTDTDAARAALRKVASADGTRERAALSEVLSNVRDAIRNGQADGRATVGYLPTRLERWEGTPDTLRPSMTRADAKAATRAIRSAYLTTSREACEQYRPDRPTGEVGWKVQPRTDARTLASPVVWRDATGAVIRITRDVVKMSGKGSTRERAEWTEILYSRDSAHYGTATASDALSIRGTRTDGTRWTPDASTYAADRFAEALEPAGAVAKPNTRKRKRDGRIGGSAVITRTPTRGAR